MPFFLGDLHIGSHHAGYPSARLPETPPRLETKYLNDCLDHALQSMPKRVSHLVLMGDLIEGRNPKGQGTGLYSAKFKDQVEAAIEIIAPFAKRADYVLRVKGTDYHDDIHDPLYAMDQALGVHKARQVFDLRMPNGRVLNAAHHPSGGGAMYMGTKLDKEQRLMRLAADEMKVAKATWIVRAHLHTFSIFKNRSCEVVLLPCFKLPDAHSIKGNLYGWQPDIGTVLMDRDTKSEFGYTFRENLYSNPPQEVFDVENDTEAISS